jgi:hypothetical protein
MKAAAIATARTDKEDQSDGVGFSPFWSDFLGSRESIELPSSCILAIAAVSGLLSTHRESVFTHDRIDRALGHFVLIEQTTAHFALALFMREYIPAASAVPT